MKKASRRFGLVRTLEQKATQSLPSEAFKGSRDMPALASLGRSGAASLQKMLSSIKRNHFVCLLHCKAQTFRFLFYTSDLTDVCISEPNSQTSLQNPTKALFNCCHQPRCSLLTASNTGCFVQFLLFLQALPCCLA